MLPFSRAAAIQTQSWPAIGRSWLGLGMGCRDSCLEMMEGLKKGAEKSSTMTTNQNDCDILFPQSILPTQIRLTQNDNHGDLGKSTKGNKLWYKWETCFAAAHY